MTINITRWAGWIPLENKPIKGILTDKEHSLEEIGDVFYDTLTYSPNQYTNIVIITTRSSDEVHTTIGLRLGSVAANIRVKIQPLLDREVTNSDIVGYVLSDNNITLSIIGSSFNEESIETLMGVAKREIGGLGKDLVIVDYTSGLNTSDKDYLIDNKDSFKFETLILTDDTDLLRDLNTN